jgi:MinD-like ATPase involved in chromosome partitioning or flagellar assembly
MRERAVTEPEVALVFTPEEWVEVLHRHLTDHGGARVRQIVVEPEIALEESYDVLVVGNRWPALTHAFVAAVQSRGHSVLAVYAREEPAARSHLAAIGVDAAIESDSGPRAFVEMLQVLRAGRASAPEPLPAPSPTRRGRIAVVGGPGGAGRTEIALGLGVAVGGVLVDADDVAPAIGVRLGVPPEPNLRTAIDAVEHARGDLSASLVPMPGSRCKVVAGLPSASGWSHVRPGEVIRVLERLVDDPVLTVVDCAGSIEEVASHPRPRNAIARALLLEADVIVGVCSATPLGVARFLTWAVEAIRLAPDTELIVAVNRAAKSRFRRGELYGELTRSLPVADVEFVTDDGRVADAAWAGTPVPAGPFTRAVARIGTLVTQAPRPATRREGASERASEVMS